MLLGARQFFERRSGLPYPQVPYIVSTGSQYIDTGVLCSSLPDEFVVRCGLVLNHLGTYYDTFFGAEKNASRWPAIYWRVQPYNDQGPGRQFKSGVGTDYYVSPVEPLIGIDYDFVLDVKTSGVKYTINSVETRYNYSTKFKIPFNIYLCCLNNNGVADRFVSVNLRYFAIDGICDMVPVRVEEYGMPAGAMYDKLNSTLFRNAGTGVFGLPSV